MHLKNRGSARIMLAGGGLLSLLVVVVIIAYMGGESAEKSGEALRHAKDQAEGIQESADQRGREYNDIMDRMQGGDEGSYDVILQDVGHRESAVIKAVRSLKQIGLAEAEEIVEDAPTVIMTGLTKAQAKRAKSTLARAGARAEIDKRRD